MKSLRNFILISTFAALLAGSFVAPSPASAENTSSDAEENLPAPEIIFVQDDAASVFPATVFSVPKSNPIQSQESLLASSLIALEKANENSSDISNDAEADSSPESDLVAEMVGDDLVLHYGELVAIEKILQEAAIAKAAAERAAAFASKIASMTNGNAGQLTGMYVQNPFAMNIGEFWQFGLAAQHGSLGLLAHNYAGGGNYFSLSVGSVINIVYGDGSIRKFQVTKIRRFEALQPNSPTSQFIDLDNGGGKQSVTKVFNAIYNSSNPLVLQTCIANHGVSTWGRLFVIAVPIK